MTIEIADRLVKLRKEHNLSQEALAAKLGLSRQAISKWERAEASPDTDNLMALASLYGVSLDEILNGAEAAAENDEAQEKEKSEDKNPQDEKIQKRRAAGKRMVKFPFPLIIAAAYLLLGFCLGDWHPGWLILLFIPIYYCVGGGLCCKTNKAMLLTMPVHLTVLIVYLFFGCIFNMWHPYWIIFLLIPLYYWLVSVFYKNKTSARK